jgi:hypothetical protein
MSAKGEVRFQVGGQAYTLHYTINALAALEELLDCSVAALLETFREPARQRIKTLRSVFRAGLLEHHGEIDDVDAGKLMDALGLEGVSVLIGQGLEAAFGRERQPDGSPTAGNAGPLAAPRGPAPKAG